MNVGTNLKYIVLLQGPLHSGKTITAHRLKNIDSRVRSKDLMVTTRPPRPDDISGKKSVSEYDFKAMSEAGTIIAPHKVDSYKYGIDKSKLEEILIENSLVEDSGRVLATYEIGVESAHKDLFSFANNTYPHFLDSLEKDYPGLRENAPELRFVLLVTTKNSLHSNFGNRYSAELDYNYSLIRARINKSKELLQFLRPINFKHYTDYADTFQKQELREVMQGDALNTRNKYVSFRHDFNEFQMLSEANKVGKFDQKSIYHILNVLYQDGSFKEVLLKNLAVIADAATMSKELDTKNDRELRALQKSMHYLYNLAKVPIASTLAKSLDEFAQVKQTPTLRNNFFEPKLKKLTDYDLRTTGIKEPGLAKAIKELFVEENYFDGKFIYDSQPGKYQQIASDNLIRNLLFTQHGEQLCGLEHLVAHICLEESKNITEDALKLLKGMKMPDNKYWVSKSQDYQPFIENTHNSIASIFRSQFNPNFLNYDIGVFLRLKNSIDEASNGKQLSDAAKVLIADGLSALYSNNYLQHKISKQTIKKTLPDAGIKYSTSVSQKPQLLYAASISLEEADVSPLFFDKKFRKKVFQPFNKKLKSSFKNNRARLEYIVDLMEEESNFPLFNNKKRSRFLENINPLFASEEQNILPLTLFRETSQLNFVLELENIKNSGALRSTFKPFVNAIVSSITQIKSSHDNFRNFTGSVIPIVYRQDVTHLNLIRDLLVDISNPDNKKMHGEKIKKNKKFKYILNKFTQFVPDIKDVNLSIARKNHKSKGFATQIEEFYRNVEDITLDLAINFEE